MILTVDLCAIDQQLCEEENSVLSFEAICSIHKLMDDDADGTVDTTETDEVRQRHRANKTQTNCLSETVCLSLSPSHWIAAPQR